MLCPGPVTPICYAPPCDPAMAPEIVLEAYLKCHLPLAFLVRLLVY